MKDKMRLVLTGAAALLLPLAARAEEGGGGRDVTAAVLVLGAAALSLCIWLWKRQILPFLERHALEKEAQTVVRCVEAAFGRGHGKEKWEAALEKMAERGWNVDCAEIRDCLLSAWEILNIAQTAAGLREQEAEHALGKENPAGKT